MDQGFYIHFSLVIILQDKYQYSHFRLEEFRLREVKKQ